MDFLSKKNKKCNTPRIVFDGEINLTDYVDRVFTFSDLIIDTCPGVDEADIMKIVQPTWSEDHISRILKRSKNNEEEKIKRNDEMMENDEKTGGNDEKKKKKSTQNDDEELFPNRLDGPTFVGRDLDKLGEGYDSDDSFIDDGDIYENDVRSTSDDDDDHHNNKNEKKKKENKKSIKKEENKEKKNIIVGIETKSNNNENNSTNDNSLNVDEKSEENNSNNNSNLIDMSYHIRIIE
ncbi:hypothetical protein SNEBB_006607 [Seison nebaliae]|nr:hypothetical protein SNEBB_006607 [Seison nebaliae]